MKRRGRPRIKIKCAQDYNDICCDMIDDFLETFTRQNKLIRDYDEEFDTQFELGEVSFVYTQRGMNLYESYCSRLFDLGSKYFDESEMDIESKTMILN